MATPPSAGPKSVDSSSSLRVSISGSSSSGEPAGSKSASPAESKALVTDFSSARRGASSSESSPESSLPLWKLTYGENSFNIPEEILCGRVSKPLLTRHFNLTDKQADAVIFLLSDLKIISIPDKLPPLFPPLEVTTPNRAQLHAFLYAPSLSKLSISPETMARLGRYLERTCDLSFFKGAVNTVNFEEYSSKKIDMAESMSRLELSLDKPRMLLDLVCRYLMGDSIEFSSDIAIPLWILSERFLMSDFRVEVEAFILSHMKIPDFSEAILLVSEGDQLPKGAQHIPAFVDTFFKSANAIDLLIPGNALRPYSGLGQYLAENPDPQIFFFVVNRLLFRFPKDKSFSRISIAIRDLSSYLDEPHRTKFLMIAISRLESYRPNAVDILCDLLPEDQFTPEFIITAADYLRKPDIKWLLRNRVPRHQITLDLIRATMEWTPPKPEAMELLFLLIPAEQLTPEFIQEVARRTPPNPKVVRLLCYRLPAEQITLRFIQEATRWTPPNPEVVRLLCHNLPTEQCTLESIREATRWNPPNPKVVRLLCYRLPTEQCTLESIRAVASWNPPNPEVVELLCHRLPDEQLTFKFIQEVVSWTPPNPEVVLILCKKVPKNRITTNDIQEASHWKSQYSEAVALLPEGIFEE